MNWKKHLQRFHFKKAIRSNAAPQKKRAAIVGATSSLAYSIAHQLAAKGEHLVLVGRNKKELERLKSDITIRYGVEASVVQVDLAEARQDTGRILEQIIKSSRPVEALYMVAGDLGDTGYQERPENIEKVMRVNYTTPAKLLAAAAEAMVDQEHGGVMVVVSSAAGDRGRQSNYVYGAAKAALTTFASGLRNKFFKRGVHVVTIKPGFIDTPMTYGMNSPLTASREDVARAIIRAASKKKDVVYVPFRWQIIMGIICHIPERIFKRLSL